MKYFRGYWIHQNEIDPIAYYLEVDAFRDTVRMVEVMPNGELRPYSKDDANRGALVETTPLPEASEINSNPELAIVEIKRDIFERIWEKSRSTFLGDQAR
ncbi:MAG: hypothetical protein JNM89_05770 [Hyphomicrobiaceae bacterium]|nr:hypothetical protein [Hyphomicrobiaceae bacterium]